jgi:hypothetical protein
MAPSLLVLPLIVGTAMGLTPSSLSRQAAAGSRPNPRPCMAGSGLTRAVWEAKALLEELAS